MKKNLLLVAAALMALAPVSGFAGIRGAVFVGGPFWGPGPYWGPAYYGPAYAVAPAAGEVKLDTPVKTAEVFINGAYAGTTKQNHSMHLRPGNYNIEIREAGQVRFAENVYVVPGKTLHLTPTL